jgi:transcriptional regulator with XRE-family HTH domain
MSKINEDLKQRRRAIGMTQKELADALLVTEKSIWSWEQGQTPHKFLLRAWTHAIEEAEERANARP